MYASLIVGQLHDLDSKGLEAVHRQRCPEQHNTSLQTVPK